MGSFRVGFLDGFYKSFPGGFRGLASLFCGLEDLGFS